MLYSKISPPAVISQQLTPFSTTSKELEYMGVFARPYGLGATSVTFEIVFGIMNKDENNTPVSFEGEYTTSITLTTEDLSTWGSDDSVFLHKIASKIGTTITEFILLVD